MIKARYSLRAHKRILPNGKKVKVGPKVIPVVPTPKEKTNG